MKTRITNPLKNTKMILTVLTLIFAVPAFGQMNTSKLNFNTLQTKIVATAEEVLDAVKDYNEIRTLDNEIEFESWMMDLEEWSKEVDSSSVGNTEMEAGLESEMNLDTEMEMEEWMLETDWSENLDRELVLEDWMSEPRNWDLYSCN
jgi:hypothetical protein